MDDNTIDGYLITSKYNVILVYFSLKQNITIAYYISYQC